MGAIIPFHRPSLLPDVMEFYNKIAKALLSRQYTNGPLVNELEDKLAKILRVKHVIAVNSCTIGLMLVQSCLGLKGEVITPSFSFSATSLSLLWSGLKPVFVDINPITFNIDTGCVEEAITDSTQAILATHVFGNPCHYHALNDICEREDLYLIFDAAHAFQSYYNHDTPVGCGGIAEVFSLAPTKVLTAGEGGFISTNNSELAENIRFARNYGHNGDYNTVLKGLNGRMSEFHAAVALTHLEGLEERLKKRLEIAVKYMDALGPHYIDFQMDLSGISNNSYFAIRSWNRDNIAKSCFKAQIGTKQYFNPPIHKQDLFKYDWLKTSEILPETERLADEVLCLPIYSELTDEQVERVIKAVIEGVQ